jgi:hypothetical protein
MKLIENKTYDTERSLYGLREAEVSGCLFAGAADGESPLKEARTVGVKDCRFELRYALWHGKMLDISDTELGPGCRAPLWYCSDVHMTGCGINGVKALRECRNVYLGSTAALSDEFCWKSSSVALEDVTVESDYAFFGTEDLRAEGLKLKGKYSFQYVCGAEITGAVLDTKDAFWHSSDVTLTDCVIKSEYIGWYSENMRMVRCRISGTQPFCYARGLVLEDCTMTDCDLSFENSDVKAEITGRIDSIKTPLSGRIVADAVGELITEGGSSGSGSAGLPEGGYRGGRWRDCEIVIRGPAAEGDGSEPDRDFRVRPPIMCVYAGPEYFRKL